MSDHDPQPRTVRLDEQSIRQLAEQVAQLLREHDDPPPQRSEVPGGGGRLLSAAEVAQWWGLDRSWVYAHADQLGVHRLGTGPRPRLRFDPDEVRSCLTQTPPKPEPSTTQRHRSRPNRSDRGAPLLPYRPDTELSSMSPSERSQAPPPAPRRGPRGR